jgi:hypothetical protein
MSTTDPVHDPGVSEVLCFTQGNPEGPGYTDVPALLRRVADSIEELPGAEVQDVVFHSLVTSDSEELHITVYFHPGE